MLLLYRIAITIYYWLICLVSPFNKKAKLWINGRKKTIINPLPSSIWFHFASLGEFEQGRPVLEKMKVFYPAEAIVITFFSPSGYEVRKDTPLADFVYYLPLDTPKNAQAFVNAIKPVIAIFTKYEYWYHYFNELHTQRVPLYLISGIFRPGQVFFKWYGGLHRKMLKLGTWFFVQDADSKHLLHDIGITNASISGDTRFDRVWENAQHTKEISIINDFKNDQQLFIAGSTWPQDEALLAAIITLYPGWKFIIAPHETDADKINSLINLFPAKTTIKYSELVAKQSEPGIRQVLIIDNVGLLAALYRYADIAYIGGGFGAGIHNTLEAAVFGIPVIFGPNYYKFKEARDLIALEAGYSISDKEQLVNIVSKLITNEFIRVLSGEKAKTYVQQNTGATILITNYIKERR